MNGNTHPFQHNFIATESIEFPKRNWNYLNYGNSVNENKLKKFDIQDEYKRWYDGYIPNSVKEGDRLWISDYQDESFYQLA